MMRGFSRRLTAAVSRAQTSSGGATRRRPWLGGFNLLPYRQRDARRARRRCLLEWAGAALIGCGAMLVLAGWQVYERARLEAQRSSIERTLTTLAAPLAEHATLVRAQDDQRQAVVRARSLSEPLVHLRDLLDALSFEPGDKVVLQQLRQREHETDLLATSRGHLAPADWLKHLSAIRGVKGADVSDLRRSGPRDTTVAVTGADGPVEFGAQLRWDDPAQKVILANRPVAQRSLQSEKSRGEK